MWSTLQCRICRISLQYIARWNSNTAAITRVRRHKYPRLYPTTLVNPDGSSYTIRYHEPRQIVFLPLDFEAMDDEEKLKVLAMRKPKKRVTVVKDTLDGDSFKADQYLRSFKK